MKRECNNCSYKNRDRSMSPCSRCVDNSTIKIAGNTSFYSELKKQCINCAHADMITQSWDKMEGQCYDCAMVAKFGDLFPMWEPNEYFNEEGALV